jgi:predicted O-methyltransferase YrrM
VTFDDTRVKAVFKAYQARLAADQLRMRELGPAGFARRDEFLLPVGEEVGWFLSALIRARRPTRILELGTSYGYSTLFLAEAARSIGARVVSMELSEAKQDYAHAELTKAGLADHVDFRCGNALELLAADPGPWDFVLLDIWKELYLPCFEAVYHKLADEAVVCADNIIEPEMSRADMRRYRQAVQGKADLTSALLPIGSGIELTVKWSAGNPKL